MASRTVNLLPKELKQGAASFNAVSRRPKRCEEEKELS
jgi:hypothetical protein